jgi:hypothetical protein
LNRIFTIGGPGTSENRSVRGSTRRGSIQSSYVILDADQVTSSHNPAFVSAPMAQPRMGLFPATLIAVLSLILVAAVALGAMSGAAALFHIFSPSKQFDAFRALHEPGVVEVLLGLVAIWLLPPHPWAKSDRDGLRRRHLSRSKAVA